MPLSRAIKGTTNCRYNETHRTEYMLYGSWSSGLLLGGPQMANTSRKTSTNSNGNETITAGKITLRLNSDMRVEPDFLAPLLEGFTDEKVFSVSCQIFFADPARVREETGLTQGWWEDGALRVRHRAGARAVLRHPTKSVPRSGTG